MIRGLPVRKVRSHPDRRHYAGMFWSATNRGHVLYESRLELDRLWLADYAPEVVGIAAQPMWLCGPDGKHLRRHVPDLLLERSDGGFTVVDVKPADFARRDAVAQVFAWTEGLCATRGWSYEVWTGADPVVLANIRTIGAARRTGSIDTTTVACIEAVAVTGMTIDEVVAAADTQRGRIAVLAKLWFRSWTADLTVPLSGQTVLTW
ncbi:TnsA-like heteromeric transposase endonuclease subunit [Nocardia asiatica]|uniref:TnsA-like heteromeric transposase endonuclease subunit n=1 Tax=Nocardia asiatica TaxID=209252 RepID=UPI00245697D9|nr:TnsA-like heteromeric transposase endonuclease subunit [Nocardia asiatica]